MSAKIRILLAEDHETVREGLKLIVNTQADMEVVGEAGNGQMAVQLAQELLPDIVIMDVSMPGWNGLKATEKLNRTCPQVRVLALTRHTEDGYLHQLLRAGAAGYVLKQSPPSEVTHAIRAVAKGGQYLDPAITGKVMGGFLGSQSAHKSETQVSISDREAEVLRLIAWGHSYKEIAARMEISVKTVDVHRTNAMKKLGMKNRIDIVRYALLQGWLQEN